MKFVQLTDTHVRKQYDNEGMDAVLGHLPTPADNARKILQNTDWAQMDFVVITGDLVHEGTCEDYKFLKNLIEEEVPSDKKVLYVLGNHDKKEAFHEGFFGKKEGASHYYVEYVDGYRLIVLDSAVPDKESGTILTEQLEWLAQVLAEPSEKGSMIFVHHPLFWCGEQLFPMEVTNSKEVMEILNGTDVFAIFSGHTHQNATNVKDGVVQYTSDSSAFSLTVQNKSAIAFIDKVGYLNAAVEGHNVTVLYETLGEYNTAVAIPFQQMAGMLEEMDA